MSQAGWYLGASEPKSPSSASRPLHMHWKDKDIQAGGRTESTSRWESTLLEARTDLPHWTCRTNGAGPGESAFSQCNRLPAPQHWETELKHRTEEISTQKVGRQVTATPKISWRKTPRI